MLLIRNLETQTLQIFFKIHVEVKIAIFELSPPRFRLPIIYNDEYKSLGGGNRNFVLVIYLRKIGDSVLNIAFGTRR